VNGVHVRVMVMCLTRAGVRGGDEQKGRDKEIEKHIMIRYDKMLTHISTPDTVSGFMMLEMYE